MVFSQKDQQQTKSSLFDSYVRKHENSIRSYIHYLLTSKKHTTVFIGGGGFN